MSVLIVCAVVVAIGAVFFLIKNQSTGPNVTVRGHRTSLCKQAQKALNRCTSKRSHDVLKTCATDLERVHRECPN